MKKEKRLELLKLVDDLQSKLSSRCQNLDESLGSKTTDEIFSIIEKLKKGLT